ncbi:hypothetical protein FIBSPDRAFT_211946 [Athelia psychrophila]|uniref:Uncharacterized protein n=1 Tax=Athelia psychrophila TaxID=1759441 RepID=A0A166WU65_9AGAM|nr:hypothetical protein FIBSPDRAFT_211946 [Fibularhizoctonia sp. CBS 109695]
MRRRWRSFRSSITTRWHSAGMRVCVGVAEGLCCVFWFCGESVINRMRRFVSDGHHGHRPMPIATVLKYCSGPLCVCGKCPMLKYATILLSNLLYHLLYSIAQGQPRCCKR